MRPASRRLIGIKSRIRFGDVLNARLRLLRVEASSHVWLRIGRGRCASS